jgi:uncharacterized protein YjbI with pentapeptide repeats
MADQQHLDFLRQGTDTWNKWRRNNPRIQPDLSGADLSHANLSDPSLSEAYTYALSADYITPLKKFISANADTSSGTSFEWTDLIRAILKQTNPNANLGGVNLILANLDNANLSEATLVTANLIGASLRGANLNRANLSGAILLGADLSEAILSEADLRGANLIGAILERANLGGANISDADLRGADLTGCNVYAISAWKVELEQANQSSLIITPFNEPTITVDDLEVAQFIYLLLNNKKIRKVIDTIAKKAVLILGRFTPERKVVLDALKEVFRNHGYLPILFDFEKPSSQDLTETVSTLAHLSRFIIVDLTDPSSAPYEVGPIASNHIRPIQALFQPSDKAKRVFPMFQDLIRRYHWVLPPYEYQDLKDLLASLQTKVIEPAEQKAQELEKL